VLPCLIHEDDHLLVINKPAGLNTHAPSPYAGEGIYDWLRHREPRWANLAIIHRLDKETSGVIVFSKTTLASRSLTQQFTAHTVRKAYVFLTDHTVPAAGLNVKTALVRTGEKYASRPRHAGSAEAETRFRPLSAADIRNNFAALELESWNLDSSAVEAEPLTGRTHQIRVHAADSGFPILGDTLYGGTPAARVFLHSAKLTLQHPGSSQEVTFCAPLDFAGDPRLNLRAALLSPEDTDAYRLLHGASDGWPGWYVERLGDYLLSQAEQPLNPAQQEELARLAQRFSARGAYHKILSRQVRQAKPAAASPQLTIGAAAPERFAVHENGLAFELSFQEGYSVGLFLDQRDNRHRLLTGHIAAKFALAQPQTENRKAEVLNAFAYTCGFSVCAAQSGAHTTSLDLSKKYLEWGKRNFALNQLDSAEHEFIYGDVFDWLRRFAKKKRQFDLILLDPPTFSQSKTSGVFRVEKDYGRLFNVALSLLKLGGVLFCSTNAANWPPEAFLACLEATARRSGKRITQKHYAPEPPDFPISRLEPAYLKTVWLRVE
jgi:23S rRNA (cytosine1962-C5)-methyltransferase